MSATDNIATSAIAEKKKYRLMAEDSVTTIATFYNYRPREAALKAATRGHKKIVLREPLDVKKNQYRFHIFEGHTVPIKDEEMREYEKRFEKTLRPHVKRMSMDRMDAGLFRLKKSQVRDPEHADDIKTKFDERVRKDVEKKKRQRKIVAAAARAERKAAAAAIAAATAPKKAKKEKTAAASASASASAPKKAKKVKAATASASASKKAKKEKTAASASNKVSKKRAHSEKSSAVSKDAKRAKVAVKATKAKVAVKATKAKVVTKATKATKVAPA